MNFECSCTLSARIAQRSRKFSSLRISILKSDVAHFFFLHVRKFQALQVETSYRSARTSVTEFRNKFQSRFSVYTFCQGFSPFSRGVISNSGLLAKKSKVSRITFKIIHWEGVVTWFPPGGTKKNVWKSSRFCETVNLLWCQANNIGKPSVCRRIGKRVRTCLLQHVFLKTTRTLRKLARGR